MFAFTSVALLALAAIARADIIVSTPASLELCKSAEFQISGSTNGPYHAWVTKGTDPCGDAYHEDLAVDGNVFKWTPDLPAGTSVMIEITNDSGDVEGWSGAITISGTDSSCVTSSGGASGTTATRTTANGNRATTAVPNNAASTPSDTTSGAGRTVFGAASALTLAGAAMAVLAL